MAPATIASYDVGVGHVLTVHTRLGSTGPDLSRFCLGCWTTGTDEGIHQLDAPKTSVWARDYL